MKEAFSVGKVVQLASGGPKMTVVEVGRPKQPRPGDDRFVRCAWFNDGDHIEFASFPPAALVREVK
jgi:uncharacterized protein YodC (DUF2158 family)